MIKGASDLSLDEGAPSDFAAPIANELAVEQSSISSQFNRLFQAFSRAGA